MYYANGYKVTYADQSERFTGEMSDEVNSYLKDTYREPFVLTENA